MKLSFLKTIIITVAFSSTIFTISQPSQADQGEYFCSQLNGTYQTFKRTERGNMTLFNFERAISEGWDRKKRCVEVSRRFQAFKDNDMLKVLGSGQVNNEPVLCAVLAKEENCSSDNVLVTLPPGTDPTLAAQQLIGVSGLRKRGVLDVRGKRGRLATYVNGNVYYDLEILERRIMQNGDRIIQEDLIPITDY